MIKKRIIAILLTLFNLSLFSQNNTCEGSAKVDFDLNSITKCSVENKDITSKSGKKTKQISVKVSSSVRYLKKRNTKSKVSGLGQISSSGVENKTISTDITSSLSTEETITIKKLKETLSKEQLDNSYVFDNVDQIPLFTSCKTKNKKENLNCFNEKMTEHLQSYIQYPTEAVMENAQGDIWVRFVIDEQGNITNLKTISLKNNIYLNQEAERVVSKLANFKPAKKGGKNVMVKYGFPINFSLED